jgi:hypothetical protein
MRDIRTATAQVLRFPHLQEKRRAAFCRNQDGACADAQSLPSKDRVERAMGIEPTRAFLPSLQN